ncbi:hypothetical protein B0H21DRAFT_146941 [Amylocystis lapponica]|nr:hypothetical protein B0H21DRAFT_146941 [Amylocystis lapponica]
MSRGLPHQLTRNLGRLFNAYHYYISRKGAHKRTHWNGQLSPNADAYKPKVVRVGSRQQFQSEKKARWVQTDDQAWGALGEVIMMAEGKHRISLGRIRREVWMRDAVRQVRALYSVAVV